MAEALYHPELGYYTRPGAQPFGPEGDFYTATQVQPVFGRLVAQLVKQCGEEHFIDWGAGAEALRPFFGSYTAVDARRGALPDRFRGFVFANELFDALPVDVFVRRDGVWVERRVTFQHGEFAWMDDGAPSQAQSEWLARYALDQENFIIEVNLEADRMLAELASRMESGWLLAIDYGVTRRELIRFPEGTLMSYRRHAASDGVLDSPGDHDLTAHVHFDALRASAQAHGFREESFESMASLLLRAGEADRFASVLDSPEPMAAGLRMQLKTLLFGMGETFRAVMWRREKAL